MFCSFDKYVIKKLCYLNYKWKDRLFIMRDKILQILNDIEEDIVLYEGENLFDDGIIDSFTIVEILSEINDKLGINISPDDVKEANFKTVDKIICFIESINSGNNI